MIECVNQGQHWMVHMFFSADTHKETVAQALQICADKGDYRCVCARARVCACRARLGLQHLGHSKEDHMRAVGTRIGAHTDTPSPWVVGAHTALHTPCGHYQMTFWGTRLAHGMCRALTRIGASGGCFVCTNAMRKFVCLLLAYEQHGVSCCRVCTS